MIVDFLKDLRLGTRVLLRSPLVSLWLILTLALGIGANTAMFSLIDALLLHPVDYRSPENLVMVWHKDYQGVNYRVSAGAFEDLRSQTRSFSNIAGWAAALYVMTGLDRPQQLGGAAVTDNFFSTLGVAPVLGRTFLPGEDGVDQPGSAEHVAVISYRLWQDAFAGSRAVLGRAIQLNGLSYTIVGVLPPDFQFMLTRQIYVPISINRAERDSHYIATVARLRGERATAAAEVRTLARSIASQNPLTDQGWSIEVQDVLEWAVDKRFRLRLLLLSGAVLMVLLITCTNVAGLLLTRAISRGREMAVRVALGAPRTRLVRQLFTENLLLAGAGTAAGVLLAAGLIQALPSLVPASVLPTAMPIRLNVSVLGGTVLVAVLASIFFGLVPAFAVARLDVMESLKSGGRSSTESRGAQRLRQVMVVFQFSVALVLLSTGALMTESLGNLMRSHPGFNIKDVFALPLFLPSVRYDGNHVLSFDRELVGRVGSWPGVEAAAVGANLPLYGITIEVPFDLEDAPPKPEAMRPGVGYTSVTPEYFSVLQVPLLAGRHFSVDDRENTAPVVIVNQAFVQHYFAGRNPVGKRLLLNRPVLDRYAFEATIRPEVVGVVGDVRWGSETDQFKPVIYAPIAQNVWSDYSFLVVRSSGNPGTLVEKLRSAVGGMDSGLAASQITRLEQRLSTQFTQPKFQAGVIGGFAALAVLLAIIGIYGVTNHHVVLRHSEIGLRMALGAAPSVILGEVLTSSVGLALLGVGIGIVSAGVAGFFLRSMLVGISPTDPATLFVASGGLLFVSLLAVFFPALRATQVEPISALRRD